MRKRKVVRHKVQRINHTIDETQANKLVENALNTGCLLWIDGGAWGNRKKVSTEELASAGFNAKTTRAVRDLVDRSRIAEVTAPINKAHNWARNHSMPWLNNSVHFIHKLYIDEADTFMKECQEELKKNVQELVEEFEDLKNKAWEEDPEAYNERNYPDKWSLESKFRLRYGFNLVSTPSGGAGQVSVLPKEILKEEDRKFREMVKETFEDSVKLIRGMFEESIKHLAETLQNPNKVFKESTVEKPKIFLEEFFKTLNIYGDTPFSELAEKVKKMLDGVYAEDLRDDKEYRRDMGFLVNKVVKAFDGLPLVTVERDIEL